MERSARIPPTTPEVFDRHSGPRRLQDDLRWRLAGRVVESPKFCKSPLLSRFLLYIVANSLEERYSEIIGRQIGVQVFGRAPGYRISEDNIVRNYARQLRKRLAEYFAGEGRGEPMRIEIPLGGYVPVFTGAALSAPSEPSRPGARLDAKPMLVERSVANKAAVATRGLWPRVFLATCLLAAYSLALICITWLLSQRGITLHRAAHQVTQPSSLLWASILGGPRNTYIVPTDAGLNLLEEFSHHSLPLAEYVKGGYKGLSLPRLDPGSAADLRTSELTSFVDMQIVTALAERPEYSPDRIFLRFPRDLRIDDLEVANAVIVGSGCSNPWAAVAEANTNFHIVCNVGSKGATVLNTRPLTGEPASCARHLNGSMRETFALIAFVPNLTRNGHLLLIEGLDDAGTQAAAEELLHPEMILSILERARRADGSLAGFEILLHASRFQSNAAETRVIASRIH